jgi:hypothetical protein
MADCSQHLVQIMENQTRFNLEAALQEWRQEMAAQPNLAPEARRELETHVRDTVAELQRRGLNDEESFWLARRRVGQPHELANEFKKADPAKAGRQQALRIAGTFLALYLWQAFVDAIWNGFVSRSLHINPGRFPRANSALYWAYELAWQFVICLPLVWLAFSVARGRPIVNAAIWQPMIRSRWRFLAWAFLLLATVRGFEISWEVGAKFFSVGDATFISELVLGNIWPGLLIVAVFLLLPGGNARPRGSLGRC